MHLSLCILYLDTLFDMNLFVAWSQFAVYFILSSAVKFPAVCVDLSPSIMIFKGPMLLKIKFATVLKQ